VEAVLNHEACHRLKIRHDDAHEAVLAQDAAELGEGSANLMLVEMLDAVRRPHRIRTRIGYCA
jgi:hypothetical protein